MACESSWLLDQSPDFSKWNDDQMTWAPHSPYAPWMVTNINPINGPNVGKHILSMEHMARTGSWLRDQAAPGPPPRWGCPTRPQPPQRCRGWRAWHGMDAGRQWQPHFCWWLREGCSPEIQRWGSMFNVGLNVGIYIDVLCSILVWSRNIGTSPQCGSKPRRHKVHTFEPKHFVAN